MYSLAIYKNGVLYAEKSLFGIRALSIGRDPLNDIVLTDSSSKISCRDLL